MYTSYIYVYNGVYNGVYKLYICVRLTVKTPTEDTWPQYTTPYPLPIRVRRMTERTVCYVCYYTAATPTTAGVAKPSVWWYILATWLSACWLGLLMGFSTSYNTF